MAVRVSLGFAGLVAAMIAVLPSTAGLLVLPQKSGAYSAASRQSLGITKKALTLTLLYASETGSGGAFGLYRPFAEHGWSRLWETCGMQLEAVELASDLRSNDAPSHGGGTVRITVNAATGSGSIRYARYALLETVAAGSTGLQTTGVQVLNMVVFPAVSTGLPVFGADFVSLPGNKHLLLLDAQPVVDASETAADEHWKEWYEKHAIATQFPWGGDLPEKVQPYVSKHALWTRLGGGKDESDASVTTDSVQLIRGPVMAAFSGHLEVYLNLMLREGQKELAPQRCSVSRLPDYIRYRLENDPARPMLKRLFGEEWTENVLHGVLFPQL